MNRIAFIQFFRHEIPGPMILSAVLKRGGHETAVFIIGGEPDAFESVRAFAPDIAAFSVTTGEHGISAETARQIKSALPKCVTIAGGAHATFYPEFINEAGFDALCRGEGEEAMLELAGAVGSGGDWSRIRNLVVKTESGVIDNPLRPAVANLEALPLPDYDLYYQNDKFLKSNPGKMFLTGRGCPFACTFCFNHAMGELYSPSGGYPVRRLSPQRAADMITWVRRDHGLRFVRFDDDVFILDKKWLFAFLEIYRAQIGLPFSCLVRANLMDDETAAALAAAGCRIAHFGIESGDQQLRNDVLRKNITDEQIIRCASLLRKHRIRIGTFNMLNLPGETLAQGLATARLNRRIRAAYPWCSLIQPYPGTRLEQTARDRGLLPENFAAEHIPISYFRESPIQNPDRAALENLHKFFFLAVRAPWLEPLIKLFVKLPANRFFDLVFKTTYAFRYMKVYKTPLWRVIQIGRLNRKQY